MPLYDTSRFGNMLLDTAKVIFETHNQTVRASAAFCPIDAQSRTQWDTSS
jgi:hypothetical protein